MTVLIWYVPVDQKADPVDRWLHLTVIQKFCLMGIGNVVLCKGNLGISNLLEIIMMKSNLLYCDNTMMINDVIFIVKCTQKYMHVCSKSFYSLSFS